MTGPIQAPESAAGVVILSDLIAGHDGEPRSPRTKKRARSLTRESAVLIWPWEGRQFDPAAKARANA